MSSLSTEITAGRFFNAIRKSVTEIIDEDGDGLGNGLRTPIDIAVDSSGNVYVTGSGTTNNAFKVSPASDTVIEIIDMEGDGINMLTSPLGITADDDGNVYVAAKDSNNVFSVPEPGHAFLQLTSVLVLVGLRRMRR